MRERVVPIAIINYNDDVAHEIYNSLRYSTHVQTFMLNTRVVNHDYSYRTTILDTEKDTILNLLQQHHVELVFIAARELKGELLQELKAAGIQVANVSLHSDDYDTFGLMGESTDNVTMLQEFEDEKNLPTILRELKRSTGNAYHATHVGLQKILVDCFRDRHGNTLMVSAVTQVQSESNGSQCLYTGQVSQRLTRLVEHLGNQYGFRGAWSLEIDFAVEEQSPSRPGRIRMLHAHKKWVIHRARGVNVPLLCVQDFLDRDLKIVPLIPVENISWDGCSAVKLRIEYASVFIDLDETLILDKNRVPDVVNFVENARRNGKEIILITRHKNDITQALTGVGINTAMFDQIIHVEDGERKSDKINAAIRSGRPTAIFIDNEFPERRDVVENCGIPVFDVNGIDFLET